MDPPIYELRSGREVHGVDPETNEALRTSATRRWTAIMRKHRAIPKHLITPTIRRLATTRVEAGDLPRNETEVFDQWLFEQLRRTEELQLWPVDDDTVGDTVAVRAPAGPLGVFFFGHRVSEVQSWSPLAGQVAVGNRLVSIDAPGRALFTCAGRNVTGLDIIHELRAGAASDGRVLTFGREYRAGRS